MRAILFKISGVLHSIIFVKKTTTTISNNLVSNVDVFVMKPNVISNTLKINSFDEINLKCCEQYSVRVHTIDEKHLHPKEYG